MAEILAQKVGDMSLSELMRLLSREVSRQIPAIPAQVAELTDADKPIVRPPLPVDQEVITYNADTDDYYHSTAVALITDGVAPIAGSPTPTLQGGVGFLTARWDATGNVDPTAYDVHLGTSSGFSPGAASRVATVSADRCVIKQADAAGTALSYGQDYFCKLVAFDDDSAAAAGAASLAQKMVPAATVDIAVGSITAASGIINDITAATITAGDIATARMTTNFLSAAVATITTLSAITANLGTITAGTVTGATLRTAASGARVVMDSTNGLVCYDSGSTDYGGGVGVVVKMPLSGSPFLYGTVYASGGVRIDAGTGTSNRVYWGSGAANGYLQGHTDGTMTLSNVAGSLLTRNILLQAGNTAFNPSYSISVNTTAQVAGTTDTTNGSKVTIDTIMVDAAANSYDYAVDEQGMVPWLPFPGARQTASGAKAYPTAKFPSMGFYEEFMGLAASTVNVNSLLVNNNGAGSGWSGSGTLFAGHPGVAVGDAGTTNAGISVVREISSTRTLGEGWIRVGGIVRIPTASSAGERFHVSLGMWNGGNTFATLTSDHIAFRYADNVNSGKWQVVHRKNSLNTASTVDTGVTVSAGNWYMLELWVSPDSNTVYWWVNNTMVLVTTNANAASAGVNIGCGIEKTVGTTSRTFQLDALWGLAQTVQRWT